MAEITEVMIDKYIADFKTQRENLTAQVHAVGGAIQILEVLKKQLTEPNDTSIPTV